MRFPWLIAAWFTGLSLAAPFPSIALPLGERQSVVYLDRTSGSKGEASKVLGLAGPAPSRLTGPFAQTLESFFADVLGVQLASVRNCATCSDPVGASPEPTALLLFGSALAGVGLVVRRRLRRMGTDTRT